MKVLTMTAHKRRLPARSHLRRNGSHRPAAMPGQIARELVQLFKLLSDETRLRILHYLVQEDELHVRGLCELLSQSQPAVSHHLALLRDAGLIGSRRQGKHNYYRLLPERIQEILDAGFADVPKQDRRLRFEDYVLAYSPAVDGGPRQ